MNLHCDHGKYIGKKISLLSSTVLNSVYFLLDYMSWKSIGISLQEKKLPHDISPSICAKGVDIELTEISNSVVNSYFRDEINDSSILDKKGKKLSIISTAFL